MVYQGVIIEESLDHPQILESLRVKSSRKDGDWHLYDVVVEEDQIRAIEESIKPGTWYAHFWNGDDVVVVFQGKSFRLKHSDQSSWEPAAQYGESLGIPR